MKTELNSYYRALERKLECPKARREVLMEETRRAVTNFTEENPHAEFSDVARFLGEPEELARTYNETQGPEVGEKFRRGRRLRKILLLAAAAVVVAAAVIFVVYLDRQHHKIHITSEETIVIYETEEGEN